MSKDLALDDNTKDVNIVRTQGFTAAGNSGSPVVNCAGQVVGVMVSSIPFIWDDTEQASWFIPIDQLATNFEDATQNNSITKI